MRREVDMHLAAERIRRDDAFHFQPRLDMLFELGARMVDDGCVKLLVVVAVWIEASGVDDEAVADGAVTEGGGHFQHFLCWWRGGG